MTGIEIALPNGSWRQIVSGAIEEFVVPVVRRDAPPQLVRWGGFIRQDKARAQLHARAVLIEILGWSQGSIRYGWTSAGKNEFLQGCLIRAFGEPELIVYGVTFGRKPRIVTVAGKERVFRILQFE